MLGTQINKSGLNKDLFKDFFKKYLSISSVALKSAITPSFKGFNAITFPGVLPKIFFASFPTERIFPVSVSFAITEGSSKQIPLSSTYTRTEAVPKSIATLFLNLDMASPIYFLIYQLGLIFPK